jgi:hypothetical protein
MLLACIWSRAAITLPCIWLTSLLCFLLLLLLLLLLLMV